MFIAGWLLCNDFVVILLPERYNPGKNKIAKLLITWTHPKIMPDSDVPIDKNKFDIK